MGWRSSELRSRSNFNLWYGGWTKKFVPAVPHKHLDIGSIADHLEAPYRERQHRCRATIWTAIMILPIIRPQHRKRIQIEGGSGTHDTYQPRRPRHSNLRFHTADVISQVVDCRIAIAFVEDKIPSRNSTAETRAPAANLRHRTLAETRLIACISPAWRQGSWRLLHCRLSQRSATLPRTQGCVRDGSWCGWHIFWRKGRINTINLNRKLLITKSFRSNVATCLLYELPNQPMMA